LNRPRGARNPWAHESTPKEPDMIRYLSTLALSLAAAFLAPDANAEKVLIYREGQQVQPQDVAAVLGRSIKLLDDEAAPAKTTSKPTPSAALVKTSAHSSAPARSARSESPAEVAALSLPVHFAFGSAEILPEARAQLDALAEGIKLLPPQRTVTVEGHTDAVGSDAYNLELSRARSHAVRDYLVQRHGIDAARLKTVGYGKERPLEGADPYAALNRRVQFRGS
jgi:outer membrane protein OmpA-like peptidoglycan-associated protein